MFYAADNQYSNETSTGFANTWMVLAFENRKTRDAWVQDQSGLAARAITRADIANYVNRVPKPFTGECYAVTIGGLTDRNVPGFVGYVDVATTEDAQFIEPLKK